MTLRKRFHHNGHMVCSVLNYICSYIAFFQRGQMANCCCLKYSVSISHNYSSEGCLKCFKSKRLLTSSKNLHFQNEAKCITFLVKMSFICKKIKNHFHIKGWALDLVLIQKSGGTRKWFIGFSSIIIIIIVVGVVIF